jgi:hypothetical protein
MLRADQEDASRQLACGLAEEVVRTHGELRLRVFGTSMAPAILPGDVVSIRRASLTDISPDEIVLFSREGRFFVHRVVDRRVGAAGNKQDEPCLITRGDCLRHDDPPVSSPELLGRVVGIERGNRKVKLPGKKSKPSMARLLWSSGRFTYLYVRIAGYWRTLFLRSAKCRA